MSLSLYNCAMQRLQTFKYERMPNDRQKWQMRCFAGTCRLVYNKALLGTGKHITVNQSCGKRYVSRQIKREVKQPILGGGTASIDMGIARFATLSNGIYFVPLNRFNRHETHLGKAQQTLLNKVKFSDKNPPKRLRSGITPPISTVGIPGLRPEDVKTRSQWMLL